MRSSKQRSRSKQNRNRSVGNVVNRVFDSSGPEGKVRGTPQQIIDKYNQLARDAQLAGDRVATENFQQHSEHYTRMLAEAMQEQETRRLAQEAQQRERQQQQQQQRNERDDQKGDQRNDRQQDRQPDRVPDHGAGEQPDVEPQPREEKPVSEPAVVEIAAEGDTGLVETPESKPAPKPRTRRARKPAAPKPETDESDAPEAAE